MAVVKSPLNSMDARGSVGGVTYSFTRGGYTAKRKPKPTRRLRAAVNLVRSILGYLARQWGELSNEQRESWGTWALTHPGTDKFGDPFIMSGFNAFIMLNHHRMRIDPGEAYEVLPPEDPPASSPLVLSAAAGAGDPGDVDLTWTETGIGIAADFWEIAVAGPFQSEGRVAVETMYKVYAFVAGNVLMETIEDLDEGMWYWFKIRYIDEYGQVTAEQVAQTTPKVTV